MLQITKEELKEIIADSFSKITAAKVDVYKSDEMSTKLKTNVDTINYLRKYGFLKGIRVGKNWVYSDYNILMFFMDSSGLDLSSKEKCKFEGIKRNVESLKI